MDWQIVSSRNVNKTLVTYLGGSAGDLFTASINGIHLDLQGAQHLGGASVEYSLKKFESAIESGTRDLLTTIIEIPWSAISTHLYEPLKSIACPVVSLIVNDDDTITKIILRQMQFQKLIIPNDNGTFSSLFYKLVANERWEKASELWLAMADRLWRQRMSSRIACPLPGSRILNFNRLFYEDFVDDLERQGWTDSIDLIKANHQRWLSNNIDFSTEKTLLSIRDKIRYEFIS